MPKQQAKCTKTASRRKAAPKAAKGIVKVKVSNKDKKTKTKLPVVLPEAALKALEAERSRLLKQLQPLQALQQQLDRANIQLGQDPDSALHDFQDSAGCHRQRAEGTVLVVSVGERISRLALES